MEFIAIWIIVSFITAILWAINGIKWNNDKRVILYHYLMSKGCKKCGGKLSLGDFTKQYINVDCDDCDSTYQIDTMVEMAWENDSER